MFKKLLPKEEKYFEDFREMISYIVLEIGKYTDQLFSSDVIDKSLLLKLKPLEARCDEISSKIVKRLNKTFITPFDREDIFALIKRLNNISDMLINAAARVDTFDIRHKIKYADQITQIVVRQLEELDKAIQDLKAKSINECKAVKDLEGEADKVYQQAMKELFARETNAINLIKEKEILEFLENASDKCQSSANIVLSIFIKNA
jgi:uncharacterized protein